MVRVRFLLDENFPGNTIDPLERLAKTRHSFFRAGRDYPTGISDLELFATAAELGAEAVITADILQVQGHDRRNERAACRAAGLHWIGMPRHPHARGRRIAHLQLAQLVSTLEPLAAQLGETQEPSAFLLKPGSLNVPFQDGYPQVL